jgi:hypothetical protein
MSNLKLGCPSRSQWKWSSKKWDFFQGLFFLQTSQRKIKFALKKDGLTPAEKSYFLLAMYFLAKLITNLTSNFTKKRECYLTTEWCQGCWILADKIVTLGPLKSVAIMWPFVVFKETYTAGILHVWYVLIDLHSTLSHVKFKEGSSISVLQTRAAHHRIYNEKS